MIVELRSYRIKSGRRGEFLQLFHSRTVPLQRKHGIAILGPFIDRCDPDRFYWARAYATAEDRERLNEALYSDPEWTGELRPIMLGMLVEYDEIVTETDPGFIDDFAGFAGPR
jgi:hypothetical protein